ncbi:MAG TPA: MFS transporter [Gammaproteobacteria bacterium]|nr:MFS transporter [Gammaproteobacteria bacterium]
MLAAGGDAANRRLLFILSNLSILMIGLGFAVRSSIAGDLQTDLFDALDLARSATMVGEVIAATFIGFALTLLFGGALVDLIGMRLMLGLAAVGYILGSLLVVAALSMAGSMAAYWTIYAGLLLTGLGWGAVEAASNPLVAAIYPEEKTHRLNILHAWWPAGVAIGSLLGIGIDAIGWDWRLNLLLLTVPAIVLIALIAKADFPVTERVAMGLSYQDMFAQLLRSPGFFIWLLCMMGTVTAELAPGQWVDITLTNTLGISGLWILIYTSTLMFVGRHFAGPIVARISSTGLLTLSCVGAALGLYALSLAYSALGAFLAATLWGLGVCFLYPTMLGNVAERYPAGGALMLGMMGFAGGMATQYVLPQMGAIFDSAKIEAAGSVAVLRTLSGSELDAVVRIASIESFQAVAIIPALLVPIFFVLWRRDRAAQVTTE